MSLLFAARSDRGMRQHNNEDYYRAEPELGLYVVCDGVGGHAAGEEASRRAADFVVEFVASRRDELRVAGSRPGGYFRLTELLEEALQHASREIHRLARSSQDLAGMATTATALLVVDRKGVMGHVGDTRLYVRRGDAVHLLSTDHTLAQELVKAGSMDPAAAAESPYANALTRSVGGHEGVAVESLLFDLLPGDTLLLCSDGLTHYFEDDGEISSYLEGGDLEEAGDGLVDLAKRRGGRDNITLVLVRVENDAEEDEEDGGVRGRLSALEATFLFADLSLSRLSRILAIADEKWLQPGETLIAAGEPCEGMWVPVQGRVSLEHPSAPPQELGRGDAVGELSLLRTRPAQATAIAAEHSLLLFIDRQRFRRLGRLRPRLGYLLLSRLAQRVTSFLEHEGSQGTPDLEAPLRRASWF